MTFEKWIGRSYYAQKHMDAPLLEERIKYIEYWEENNYSKSTIKQVACYLLRIMELLPLEKENIITIKQIEDASNVWATYQYNHPQKRAPFSKVGKERFTWYAIDWLRKLKRLEQLPEESVPLFNRIFERRKALQRHTNAPLLNERLMYLENKANGGAAEAFLRATAQYLLIIMSYLNFYELRIVSLNEIEEVSKYWAKKETANRRKYANSKIAKARFFRTASEWFDMLGCLEKPIKNIPFEDFLSQYVTYMREGQGLSENTIKSRIYMLQAFLIHINQEGKLLSEITVLFVDELMIKKHKIENYSRRGIQAYASIIRSFLKYAENQGWCQKNLAAAIKTPRAYRHEALPYSPSWDDVKEVLAISKTDHKTDIRNYAILMLLSVYGVRCSEVTHLCLEDIDWENELLHLKRAKKSKPQTFPLLKTVGEAILNYLQRVRPNKCSLKEVFLCMRAPYRPLKSAAVYQIVSRKLKPIAPYIKHHGPHALRHACATHLINEGISLKEISDHLGHQSLETTRIYAKVDLTNLRKVAELELGDLL